MEDDSTCPNGLHALVYIYILSLFSGSPHSFVCHAEHRRMTCLKIYLYGTVCLLVYMHASGGARRSSESSGTLNWQGAEVGRERARGRKRQQGYRREQERKHRLARASQRTASDEGTSKGHDCICDSAMAVASASQYYESAGTSEGACPHKVERATLSGREPDQVRWREQERRRER